MFWKYVAHLLPNTHAEVLQSKFIEIAFLHGCFPVNLLHIFRTPFPKNTSRRLLTVLVWSMTRGKRVDEEKVDETENTEGVIREIDFSFSGSVWNEKLNDWNYKNLFKEAKKLSDVIIKLTLLTIWLFYKMSYLWINLDILVISVFTLVSLLNLGCQSAAEMSSSINKPFVHLYWAICTCHGNGKKCLSNTML